MTEKTGKLSKLLGLTFEKLIEGQKLDEAANRDRMNALEERQRQNDAVATTGDTVSSGAELLGPDSVRKQPTELSQYRGLKSRMSEESRRKRLEQIRRARKHRGTRQSVPRLASQSTAAAEPEPSPMRASDDKAEDQSQGEAPRSPSPSPITPINKKPQYASATDLFNSLKSALDAEEDAKFQHTSGAEPRLLSEAQKKDSPPASPGGRQDSGLLDEQDQVTEIANPAHHFHVDSYHEGRELEEVARTFVIPEAVTPPRRARARVPPHTTSTATNTTPEAKRQARRRKPSLPQQARSPRRRGPVIQARDSPSTPADVGSHAYFRAEHSSPPGRSFFHRMENAAPTTVHGRSQAAPRRRRKRQPAVDKVPDPNRPRFNLSTRVIRDKVGRVVDDQAKKQKVLDRLSRAQQVAKDRPRVVSSTPPAQDAAASRPPFISTVPHPRPATTPTRARLSTPTPRMPRPGSGTATPRSRSRPGERRSTPESSGRVRFERTDLSASLGKFVALRESSRGERSPPSLFVSNTDRIARHSLETSMSGTQLESEAQPIAQGQPPISHEPREEAERVSPFDVSGAFPDIELYNDSNLTDLEAVLLEEVGSSLEAVDRLCFMADELRSAQPRLIGLMQQVFKEHHARARHHDAAIAQLARRLSQALGSPRAKGEGAHSEDGAVKMTIRGRSVSEVAEIAETRKQITNKDLDTSLAEESMSRSVDPLVDNAAAPPMDDPLEPRTLSVSALGAAGLDGEPSPEATQAAPPAEGLEVAGLPEPQLAAVASPARPRALAVQRRAAPAAATPAEERAAADEDVPDPDTPMGSVGHRIVDAVLGQWDEKDDPEFIRTLWSLRNTMKRSEERALSSAANTPTSVHRAVLDANHGEDPALGSTTGKSGIAVAQEDGKDEHREEPFVDASKRGRDEASQVASEEDAVVSPEMPASGFKRGQSSASLPLSEPVTEKEEVVVKSDASPSGGSAEASPAWITIDKTHSPNRDSATADEGQLGKQEGEEFSLGASAASSPSIESPSAEKQELQWVSVPEVADDKISDVLGDEGSGRDIWVAQEELEDGDFQANEKLTQSNGGDQESPTLTAAKAPESGASPESPEEGPREETSVAAGSPDTTTAGGVLQSPSPSTPPGAAKSPPEGSGGRHQSRRDAGFSRRGLSLGEKARRREELRSRLEKNKQAKTGAGRSPSARRTAPGRGSQASLSELPSPATESSSAASPRAAPSGDSSSVGHVSIIPVITVNDDVPLVPVDSTSPSAGEYGGASVELDSPSVYSTPVGTPGGAGTPFAAGMGPSPLRQVGKDAAAADNDEDDVRDLFKPRPARSVDGASPSSGDTEQAGASPKVVMAEEVEVPEYKPATTRGGDDEETKQADEAAPAEKENPLYHSPSAKHAILS